MGLPSDINLLVIQEEVRPVAITMTSLSWRSSAQTLRKTSRRSTQDPTLTILTPVDSVAFTGSPQLRWTKSMAKLMKHLHHIPKVIYTAILVIYTICIIYIFFVSIEYRLTDFTKKRLFWPTALLKTGKLQVPKPQISLLVNIFVCPSMPRPWFQ